MNGWEREFKPDLTDIPLALKRKHDAVARWNREDEAWAVTIDDDKYFFYQTHDPNDTTSTYKDTHYYS